MALSDNLGSKRQQKKFFSKWLEEFPCINEVNGDKTRFFCTVCNKYFAAVNAGRVWNHLESKMHEKWVNTQVRIAEGDNTAQYWPNLGSQESTIVNGLVSLFASVKCWADDGGLF